MDKDKDILLINDLPGVGKVALSAMMPIVSSLGFRVHNLPTAIVSNTLDYGLFEIMDMTDYMEKTIDIWNKLNFKFDCICTGFINSDPQVELIEKIIKDNKEKSPIVMVDPIMGDDGKLYLGLSENVVKNMRKMCSMADIVTPNLTEASFILYDEMKKTALTKEEIKEYIDEFKKIGSKSVVITSVKHKEDNNYYIEGYSHFEDDYFSIPYDYINVRFPGTGDVFSAVLITKFLKGLTLKESCKAASDFVRKAMEKDEKIVVDKRMGMNIEDNLQFLK
ncbi:pyridoxamine kinase [Anaerofustis sp. NSJ-163]|uniref:pyridoxamine kinase n=1 Tax=Anaerofustis sp. NSJ-163 TaxID=2944391 RepID=UPI00209C2B95|nr:pyridoxamine kinase [Anaerofustis sp. NSJ-163]MCO8193693.1 pyridoxamine kinase [Anaerofustis sp. NSJ-163]